MGGPSGGAGRCDDFFFQAEDGIRDDLVTGVQTCALPICTTDLSACYTFHAFLPPYFPGHRMTFWSLHSGMFLILLQYSTRTSSSIQILSRKRTLRLRAGKSRSEERRVGKEWKNGWAPEH